MNKRNLIIGIIILITLVGGVVLYVASQSHKTAEVKQNNAEETEESVKEVKKETQGQEIQKRKTVTEQKKQEQENSVATIERLIDSLPKTTLKELGFKKLDMSSWKTYRNEKLGFEVKYPKGWKYEFKKNNYGKVLIIRPISCSGTYGYYENDCDDVIVILITDSPDNKLKTISGWSWAISEGSVKKDECVDGVMQIKLNIDDNFKSCLTNEFGKIHHRYFFKHDNLKYLFTIRYFDEKHSPRVEKTILETFHFTNK